MSFGITLQAFRLGYRISDKRRAFVRIAENTDGQTLNVTLVPLYQRVPQTRGKQNKLHYCWWETDDKGEDVLDLIPAIRNVKNIHQTLSFDVDRETGERITK
jgi:hypothetical protein